MTTKILGNDRLNDTQRYTRFYPISTLLNTSIVTPSANRLLYFFGPGSRPGFRDFFLPVSCPRAESFRTYMSYPFGWPFFRDEIIKSRGLCFCENEKSLCNSLRFLHFSERGSIIFINANMP